VSVIRVLFRHPVEWLVWTLAVGLAYGTGALVALGLGRPPHLVLHISVIAVLLASALAALAGIRLEWLDRRADRRAEQADRRAEERARWTVRYLRENWPTQHLPVQRAVASEEPTVRIPANRREAAVIQLNPLSPERILGYLEGTMAPREDTGETEPDEQA